MSFIDEKAIKPFNIVLDGGSGMAGLVAPWLFERFPVRKLTTLCFDVDGTFPNHEANPLIEENRRDIVERVVQEKADIGIAWDGDADRCFFIDGTGEFIAGDFVTALLAEAFLMKSPGATVLYDVRASYAVKDVVGQYGGKALMNKVGHSFFKRRMREEGAIFGGEVTGHYYFRDNFFADNGFIPALLILELMSRKGQTLHSCSPRCARSTSSRARSTPRSATCRSCRRSSRRSRRTASMRRATPTRSTASRPSSRSGTSTSAARTPSRCCA